MDEYAGGFTWCFGLDSRTRKLAACRPSWSTWEPAEPRRPRRSSRSAGRRFRRLRSQATMRPRLLLSGSRPARRSILVETPTRKRTASLRNSSIIKLALPTCRGCVVAATPVVSSSRLQFKLHNFLKGALIKVALWKLEQLTLSWPTLTVIVLGLLLLLFFFYYYYFFLHISEDWSLPSENRWGTTFITCNFFKAWKKKVPWRIFKKISVKISHQRIHCSKFQKATSSRATFRKLWSYNWKLAETTVDVAASKYPSSTIDV